MNSIKSKSIAVFIAFLFFTMFSCKKHESFNCASKTPLEDIPWLKEKKQAMDTRKVLYGIEGYIIVYKYKGGYVFWIDDCCNKCADVEKLVYNCERDVICTFGGEAGYWTCPDFFTEASESTMIFSNVQR